MSWKEYYRIHPESFCSQFGHDLLSRIFNPQDKFFLTKKESLNLALGGFSPRTRTASSFIETCQKLRPQKKDKFFLFDVNHLPLKEPTFYPGKAKSFKIQANLEKLPLANNSLDLIFLDGTTMFMKDEEVTRFGQEANRALSRFGLVVNFLKTPLFDQVAPISNFRGRMANKVPIYFRSKKRSQQLLSPLETVICFDCQGRTALIMGKKDNPLPKDPEYTYALEPAYPKFPKKIS